MRRIALALILALTSLPASSALSPLVPEAGAVSTLPAVVVMPSTVTTGSTATVTGTSFTPKCYVFTFWVRPDGTSNGTYAFTSSAGAFSLTLGFSATHGTGTEYLTAYDYCAGFWSSYYAVGVTSSAATTTGMLTAAANPVAVGGSTTVTGTGFTPNSYVFVQWRRPNGTTNSVYGFADGTGMFSFTLGFLAANGCGAETLRAYDFGTAMWSSPYTITVDGCL